jgi:hypothetical protein
MVYKLGALLVLLVLCAGSVLADDKEKKKETTVKGKVVKFDMAKKCIKLKTADGEKDYIAGDEILVAMGTGPKTKVSFKTESTPNQRDQMMRRRGMMMVGYALREGNEVELVLADKDSAVKEVHFKNQPGTRPGGPGGPGGPGAPPPSLKPPLKGDNQK